MYEITNHDTGKTITLSGQAAARMFGSAEWKEIKAGYLPQWTVVKVS